MTSATIYASKKFYNEFHLLRQSFYWFCFSLFLVFEVMVLKGFVLRKITNKWLPDMLLTPIEYSTLCISAINALYCFITYLIGIYKGFMQKIFSEGMDTSFGGRSVRSLDESKREDCVKSLYTFMSDFFKFSTQIPTQRNPNLTISSSASELDLRNKSMPSLVGYHDSPLNKSVSSVHTHSQLKELLDNETCDSIVDPTDATMFFTRDFDANTSLYRPGTVQFISMQSYTALDGIKSFVSADCENGTEAQYKRRTERRTFRRTFSSGDHSPKEHVETNIKEILKIYALDENELEAYELKLRIWLCNTILRPLVAKITELNSMLAQKYANIHIRIGQTPLDETLQHAVVHKNELYDSWLPYILPYLRIHNNQQYIVNRIQTLAASIALEDFKWNSGASPFTTEEKNAFSAATFSTYDEHFPTDSELLWHLFCTYMDFHLSPSSNALSTVTEFSKSFSNVYFVKSTAPSSPKFPPALDSKLTQEELLRDQRFYEKFFIRMTTEKPPCFELVVDGGDTVLLPLKDTLHNFWLTMILFLAHVTKYANNRIGSVSIETLSLNVFDL